MAAPASTSPTTTASRATTRPSLHGWMSSSARLRHAPRPGALWHLVTPLAEACPTAPRGPGSGMTCSPSQNQDRGLTPQTHPTTATHSKRSSSVTIGASLRVFNWFRAPPYPRRECSEQTSLTLTNHDENSPTDANAQKAHSPEEFHHQWSEYRVQSTDCLMVGDTTRLVRPAGTGARYVLAPAAVEASYNSG